MESVEQKIIDLNARRAGCLADAEKAYNELGNQHYRDNERFTWAVKTVNERYDREIEELKTNK